MAKQQKKEDKRITFDKCNYSLSKENEYDDNGPIVIAVIFGLFLFVGGIFAFCGIGPNTIPQSPEYNQGVFLSYIYMYLLITEIIFISFILCYKRSPKDSIVCHSVKLKFHSLLYSLFVTGIIGCLIRISIELWFNLESFWNTLVWAIVGLLVILTYFGINALLVWLAERK